MYHPQGTRQPSSLHVGELFPFSVSCSPDTSRPKVENVMDLKFVNLPWSLLFPIFYMKCQIQSFQEKNEHLLVF